eukprot:862970-Prymnesium_polylepis.1
MLGELSVPSAPMVPAVPLALFASAISWSRFEMIALMSKGTDTDTPRVTSAFVPRFATTASTLPSLLRSPASIVNDLCMPVPIAPAALNPPAPFPYTTRLASPSFATSTSIQPSPSESTITIERVLSVLAGRSVHDDRQFAVVGSWNSVAGWTK